MTLLAIPISCVLVSGLRFVPGWHYLRFPALVIWLAAFHFFNGSHQLTKFTDLLDRKREDAPQYQDFIYHDVDLPGHNDLILAFRPQATRSTRQVLRYYRPTLSKWAHIVHLSYDDQGALIIGSTDPTYDTLDEIVQRSNSIWGIHNPLTTDLSSMPVYADWFIRHYKPCHRYVEQADSIIEHHLKSAIPCELVTEKQALQVSYDGGNQLRNIWHEQTADELRLYLWWRNSVDDKYALSLQLFNAQGEKLKQLDRVIAGDPIDVFSFELGSLPPGDYTVNLIVYDFLTHESQPGALVHGQSFERELEIAGFSIRP